MHSTEFIQLWSLLFSSFPIEAMMDMLLSSSSSSSLNLIKPFFSLLPRFDSARFSSTRCSFTSISSSMKPHPLHYPILLPKPYHPLSPLRLRSLRIIFKNHQRYVSTTNFIMLISIFYCSIGNLFYFTNIFY